MLSNKKVFKLGAAFGAAFLLGSSALAAVFPDTQGHWAEAYIDDMNKQGIIQGYTDGSFKPEASVKVSELLVMLSRIYSTDDTVKQDAYENHKTMFTEVFGNDLAWAHQSFAVCLDAGIITETELSALHKNASLNVPAIKELLAVFITRAMKLESAAKNADDFTLSFKDTNDISSLRKAYVYVLNKAGVVEGNTNNEFEPKSNVTRAVTATMISRAIQYMKDNGIKAVLPNAEDDGIWLCGQITDVTENDDGTLEASIENGISGSAVAYINRNADIYCDGNDSSYASVIAGRYLAAVYKKDSKCTANDLISAYITTSAKQITGTVIEITSEKVTVITSSGDTQKLEIGIFTGISANGKKGGTELVSKIEKYSSVSILAGSESVAYELAVKALPQEICGVISAVENQSNGKTVLLTGLDGITKQISVPASAYITDGGKALNLTSDNVGCFAKISVVSDNNLLKASAVEIDAQTTAVTGLLKNINLNATPAVVYITELYSGKITGYDIADKPTATYKFEEAQLKSLSAQTYATVLLENGKASVIHTYPSEIAVEGEIQSITFGETIIMQIITKDGYTARFSLNAVSLPKIYRNGTLTTIDKLHSGDAVKITAKYTDVTEIHADVQSSDVSGVVTSITMEMAGNVLSLKDADGNTTSYTIASNAEILQGKKTVALSDVKIGSTVSLVVRNGEIYAIRLDESNSATTTVTGKVLFINASENSFLFQTTAANGSETNITVKINSDTKIFAASDTEQLNIKKLKIMDNLTVYGVYEGTTFQATLIIRN